MSPRKGVIFVTKRDLNNLYCQFLIAAQKNYTCTELSDRVGNRPAHDTFTRWLATDRLTPGLIWKALKTTLDRSQGNFILDDVVFDKWYGRGIDIVYRQYSGTHHRPVDGIGLTTLLWVSSHQYLPVDYRLYDPRTDGKTKNDHAREMLVTAHDRGFQPTVVLMDSWYATVDTLKLVTSYGWKFVAWIKANRKVSFTAHNQQAVADIPLPTSGAIVWLRGFGKVKVIKLVRSAHDIDYLVTNDVSLSRSDILEAAARRWSIEEYHRGLKQTAGAAFCQARSGRTQRNHIFCSLRAFLALETERCRTGLSWYELKKQVIADAISWYLQSPTIPLPVLR